MKKKFGLWLNIVTICLCVCAIAIGVYAATSATLTVSGQIGFKAHGCDVNVSGYIYGHATSSTGLPIEKESKVQLTDVAEDETQYVAELLGNTGGLSFGDVYFTDMGSNDGIPNDITIELSITNNSKYMISAELGESFTKLENVKIKPITYMISIEEGSTEEYIITMSLNKTNNSYESISSALEEFKTMSFGLEFKKATVARLDNGYYEKVKYAMNSNGTAAVSGYTSGLTDANIQPFVTDGTTVYHVTTINSSAFEFYAGLTSVTIPTSVTSIGSYAFSECTGLKEIVIPNSVTDIVRMAFSYCSNVTKVTLSNSLTTISEGVFVGCSKINNVVIPNGVTTIESSSFSGCTSLTNITIPDSVTIIADAVFDGCSILTNTDTENDPTGNLKYIGTKSNPYFYLLKTADKTLTDVVINENTKIMNASIFNDCSQLVNVVIPTSLTHINRYAFAGCKSLTSLYLPNSIISIGEGAFANSGIISLIIPKSVTTIEQHTFSECTALTSVNIPSGITSIGMEAFWNCSAIAYINGATALDTAVKSYSSSYLFKNTTSVYIQKDVDVSGYNFTKVDDTVYTVDGVEYLKYTEAYS